MNKVKHRAIATLLVAALILVGIGVYVARYLEHGGRWATFAVGGNYTSGVVNMGTILDRNGVVLANADGSSRTYAEDWSVRRACYHAVGDYSGNIGTGALTVFASQLAGYNPITGRTPMSRDGSRRRRRWAGETGPCSCRTTARARSSA